MIDKPGACDFGRGERIFITDSKKRRFLAASSRICLNCGNSFRPRQQDVNQGRGKYCSCKCARIGTGRLSRIPNEEAIKRFWNRISIDSNDECWLWNGPTKGLGYGIVKFRGKQDTAHRVSYQLCIGEIPSGFCVCHKCDIPRCCNPNHLFLGTIKENNEDMAKKKRSALGEKNFNSKLNEEQVIKIKKDERMGKEIALEYKVSEGLISMIKNEKIWRYLNGY